jgi:hypothetical protein
VASSVSGFCVIRETRDMGGSRSITKLAAVGLVSVGFVGVAGVAGSGRVLKIEGTTATICGYHCY